MTIDILAKSQSGNGNATLMLITKFNPLLKKYAYKLNYEDAYNDLLTDFISLLRNIQLEHIKDQSEGSMVSYIRTSVHNCYVKRLIIIKQLRNILFYSDLKENEHYHVESMSSTFDTYHNCELHFIKKMLTKPEFAVIYMIFSWGIP